MAISELEVSLMGPENLGPEAHPATAIASIGVIRIWQFARSLVISFEYQDCCEEQ
jgi:hypothetical protein